MRGPVNRYLAAILCIIISSLCTCVKKYPASNTTYEDPPKLNFAPKFSPADDESDIENVRSISNNICYQIACAHSKETNTVFSPFGILISLMMILNGSEGNSKEQILAFINSKSTSIASINIETARLIRRLFYYQGCNNPRLRFANIMLIDNKFQVKEAFLSLCALYYGTNIEKRDFSNVRSIVSEVNEWGRRSTGGFIEDFIREDDLSEILLLVSNSVYINMKWKIGFPKEDTFREPFLSSNSESVNVPTMHLKSIFGFYQDEDCSALRICYGDDVVMLIILPKSSSDIPDVLRKTTPNKIDKIINELDEKYLYVALPKFTIRTRMNVKEVMERCGVRNIFTKSANLSNISTGDIYISEFRQESRISVDEEGTVASSVTLFEVKREEAYPDCFRVNRPFIFIIYHNNAKLILYLGKVEMPILK